MSTTEERVEQTKELVNEFNRQVEELDRLNKLQSKIYNDKRNINNNMPKLKNDIINVLQPYKPKQLLKLTSPIGKTKYYIIRSVKPMIHYWGSTKELDVRIFHGN